MKQTVSEFGRQPVSDLIPVRKKMSKVCRDGLGVHSGGHVLEPQPLQGQPFGTKEGTRLQKPEELDSAGQRSREGRERKEASTRLHYTGR